ncbi:MAG: shikimate 5-dehydrogenase [Bdellovibrionia bacterium]
MISRLNKDTAFCMSISARPSHFGIRFHNFLYEELGLNFLYKSFAAQSPEAFDDGIRAMKSLGIRGCGISMPYKERALSWADALSGAAEQIGAINTLVNENGRLIGYNTDALAIQSILKGIPLDRNSSTVLLLGSGGMARAIAWALKDSGFKNVRISSRNLETGSRLSTDFSFSRVDSKNLPLADLLINATPIGMAPHHQEGDPIPFSREQIASAKWVIESVASPAETRLVRLSKEAGKSVITGFEITILQAAEQFCLYTGTRPSSEAVRRAAVSASSF